MIDPALRLSSAPRCERVASTRTLSAAPDEHILHDAVTYDRTMLARSGRPSALPPLSVVPSAKPSPFNALADCQHGCDIFMGRPVSVGTFTFDVRKLPEAGAAYGVWRCGVALGSFVVSADGSIQVRSESEFFLDEVLIRLVADEHRGGRAAR